MNNQKIIYFDNASKTSPCLEAVNKHHEITISNYANPSSIHALGRRNARLLDQSKEEILSLFKLNNHQVIYLSSASEANNLAIKGYALRYKNRGNHLITSSYEHPSVLESFKQLENEFGFKLQDNPHINDNYYEIYPIEEDEMILYIHPRNNLVCAAYVENIQELPQVGNFNLIYKQNGQYYY